MQDDSKAQRQHVHCEKMINAYMKELARVMHGGFQYDLNKLEQDRKDVGYAHDNRHDRLQRNLEIDEAHYAAHLDFADFLYSKCMSRRSSFSLPSHRLFQK